MSWPQRLASRWFGGALAALSLLASEVVNSAPQIQQWRTDNGMRVLFVEAHEIPMLQVSLGFNAGSTRDPADKLGLSAMTATLLDDGAGELDADAFADAVDSIGAALGASSSRDMLRVGLRTLTDADILEKSVSLLKLMLGQPGFAADSLDRERARALVGLQRHRQSPGSLAREAFYAAMYPEHAYGTFGPGTEQSLQNVTRDDLVAFQQRYLVARNGVMVMVGDLDRGAAEAIASRLAGALPAGEPAAGLAAVQDPEAAIRQIDFPSQQTHVFLGHPAIPRGHPDFFPLYVGNHILGGNGLVSMLAEQVREDRGLAYSVYSYFSPLKQRGPFIIGFQTRNDQRDLALEVVRQTVSDYVADGPDDEQVRKAKQHIVGSFPLSTNSNSKVAEFLLSVAFYDLPLDYLDTYIDKVEAVTVEQVRQALQTHIHPDRFVLVTVGG